MRACLHEAERPDDAAFPDHDLVHDDGVHADKHIFAHNRPVHHRAVAYVRARVQHRLPPGKHMYRTAFLHVDARVQYDLPPVTA